MFESKLAVTLNPQMLDVFEESKTTVEMVEKAVEKGYRISKKTPLFLFKYDAIIDLALKSFETNWTYERFELMLKNENKRKDVLLAFSRCVGSSDFNLYFTIPSKYFGDIEISEDTVNLIQKYLGIKYLEFNPDYVYSEYFDILNYSKDELFKFIKEHNIDLDRFDIKEVFDFALLISYRPDILMLEKYSTYLNESEVLSKISECISNGILKFEDVPKELLVHQKIRQSLVYQDLNLINEFSRKDLGIDMNKVATVFVEGLPESLKYMEELSKYESSSFSSSSYLKKYEEQIISAINDSGFEIVDCNWDFICSNIELMLNQFEKNPNIINTCERFLAGAYLDEKQIERFKQLLSRDEVEVNIFIDFYNYKPDIIEIVLKKNPYLLSCIGATKSLEYRGVKASELPITPSGGYGTNYADSIVDAIRMNPDNYYSLNESYNIIESKGDEAYIAALESRREPLMANCFKYLPRSSRLMDIDELRLKGGLDREVILSNYHDDSMYSLFIIANYPDKVKEDSTFTCRVSTNKKKIFKELYEDFSNYAYFINSTELSEDDLIELKDLFYKYKDTLKDVHSYVYKNPYVYIEELLRHNEIKEKVVLNDVQLAYFNKRFKELGLKCDSTLIKYIRDFDIFLDYVLNNGAGNISYDWLNEEQKKVLYDKFKEQILNGRLDYNIYPMEFFVDEFDFIKEHFETSMIAAKMGYAVINDKNRFIFDYLWKNSSYVSEYDDFEGLSDEELEYLIECNISYFKLKFKHVSEDSALYERKHIFDKVYSRITKLENMDPIDVDYLLEHNKTNSDLFDRLLKRGLIDEKTFDYCYLKIIDNIKSGSTILHYGFSIMEKYFDKFEPELFERFNMFDSNLSSKYINVVIKKDFNNVILYLIHNHNKLSTSELRSFLRNMSPDEIVGLVDQCDIKIDNDILDVLLDSDNLGVVPTNVIYRFWESAGKPTDLYELLKYRDICNEMLDLDLNAGVGFYFTGYGNSDIIQLFNVYNYFLNHENIDISVSPLFYYNDCILMKLNGMDMNMPLTRLDSYERYNLIFNLCKDNERLYSKVFGGYGISSYVKKLVNEEPLHVLGVLNYKTNVTTELIRKLKEIGYIPTKETPECYFEDYEFVKVFLDNNPDELMWMVDVLNRNDFTLSDNTVNKMISDMIIKKGIYGEFKRVYCSDEYILNSIKHDINFIDKLNGVTLSTKALKEIFPIVLEKIKSGEYVVNDNTPIFILFNEEIRSIVRESNPEFANYCYLSRLDNALDTSLIEKAILEPENVDKMFAGIDRNYPEELIDKLVEKLILIDYQVSDKTPLFLLSNTSFVYYALKHNMNIDKKYIENFTTFESYYKTLDKELFIKLINEGYGIQMQAFVRFIGIEQTLEFASQYGYLLSVIPLSSVDTEENIICELLGKGFIDVFLRSNDINKILKIIEKNDSLFLSNYSNDLMKVYSKDIAKYKNEIIALFGSGLSPYSLSSMCDNQELYELYINHISNVDYLITAINMAKEENLTKSIVLKAIRKGYIISNNSPVVIKHNAEYVELIIKACRNEEVLKKMIDSNKDIVMNKETIKYLSESSYVVSESTPDILLNNVSFIVSYLNKVTSSSDYRKVINLLNNENMITEVIRSVDLQKFILYFNIIGEDGKQDIVDKYLKNINGKRDLLSKLILDGKKMNASIRQSFENHFLNNIDSMNFDQMEKLKDCLFRIEYSNSGEIRQFASTIVSEVIKLPNYEDAFNKIERIFLTDSLPMTKKLFLVFKVLNKDYTRFIDRNSDTLSPVLLNCASDEERDAIIYRDLVQSAFASNNRSVREYLEDLDNACKLLEQYENDKTSVNEDDLQKTILFLLQLVNSRYIQNNMDKEVKLSNDYDYLITLIKDTFNGYKNLKDAVVQNLFDISTFDEAIRLLDENAKKADRENRLRAMEPFVLESGDFIKGIGEPIYLTNILQNGSVAREFLGEASGSDSTPLDTDLSKVMVVGETLEESISKTAANGYGPIWFVLKDGSHIVDTRKVGEEGHPELYDPSKLESFYTGVLDRTDAPHYGIRTGFASSQISYIVTDDKRVFLEVALNGFYIPVINKQGELVFTPEDYDKLRSKMSGLEYYGAGDFRIASKEDLMVPGVQAFAAGIQANREVISRKHNAIKEAVRKGMETVGVTMKDKLDGNVMTGCADLIDTGSTARGTDLPGKADFDYICRVDRSLFVDKKKFAEFREAIMAQFGEIETKEFAGDNFRFKGVTIPGLDDKVDLDISFVVRTTKLSLSSDESLLRVMDGIEQGSFVEPDERHEISSGSEARDLVSANILMAKKLFKAYSCYKNHRNKETPQGGLGGIGIENWVLQNGGSLKLAAEEFLSFVETSDSYDQFKRQYSVWDFGQNHYSFEDNKYSHDDFVYNNMDANGYARMVIALRNYLSMGEKAFDEEVIARIDSDVKAFLEEKAKDKSVTI